MIKVGICGFGYRTGFYLRIIKKLNNFSIVGIYSPFEEEKEKIKKAGYNVINSINEFVDLKPLFIINTMSKKINFNMSIDLLNLGFYVLQETPYSIYLKDLVDTNYYKLQIAEQYQFYPSIIAYKKLIDFNVIGEVKEIHLSLMHDYHAYSVIRYLLNVNTIPRIYGFRYCDYVARTRNRIEIFNDGLVIKKEKKHIIFKFNDKTAIYDFNSEEYRSPIRNKYIHILGTRGEVFNDIVYYLDSNNNPKKEFININKQEEQILSITFKDLELFKSNTFYNFNEDEYAICTYLVKMCNFVKYNEIVYLNKYAIEDAIMSIKMNEVEEIG